MNIIIFGQAGAGKTTTAEILRDIYNYAIFSLGRKIHAECKLHGQHKREEMQEYGQMMRKIFGKDVWNDWLYKTLQTHGKSDVLADGKVVIDDGRQLNEFDYWKEKGFITIGITAPYELRKERILQRSGYVLTESQANHDTEIQALECANKCDIQICNDKDVGYLKRMLMQQL